MQKGPSATLRWCELLADDERDVKGNMYQTCACAAAVDPTAVDEADTHVSGTHLQN
jgi:hypothetical protein